MYAAFLVWWTKQSYVTTFPFPSIFVGVSSPPDAPPGGGSV